MHENYLKIYKKIDLLEDLKMSEIFTSLWFT